MKIYHGNFVFTPEPSVWKVLEGYYIGVDEAGKICFAESGLSEEYREIPVEDFGAALVIPGFVDLHLHSSQIGICGLGYDKGDDWFRDYCYPAEHRYGDLEYARRVNERLIGQLKKCGITRACIMGTVDKGSVEDLAVQYAKSGLSARIGKMNSDRGAFGAALEETEKSKRETLEFLDFMEDKGPLVRPALCPEFAPACTAELMKFLGELSAEQGIPIHSHMSEGDFDVEMVKEAFPKERTYGKVYDAFGLFPEGRSVMAHCLNVSDGELALMAQRQVTAVHCPMAAMDGGAAFLFPARKFLNAGVPVGLGSDIGGGHTLNMMQNMTAALHMSKLFHEETPLKVSEVMYMATKGGGRLFGKVGSFEPGYEFDALVVDDSDRCALTGASLTERAVQFVYCGEAAEIKRCFCAGGEVL